MSLRQIQLSHLMVDAGCEARHFADCPPAAFAHLVDRAVLDDFARAVNRMQRAAEGAGGRLVAPQHPRPAVRRLEREPACASAKTGLADGAMLDA